MILAIIQARLGSSRLPGKVLMDVCGKPLIQHVVDRVKAIPGVNHGCLAVPHEDRAAFEGLGLDVFSVPDLDPGDVLTRFVKAADHYQADAVMRICGDCPLLAVDVGAEVVARYRQGAAPYVTNAWSTYLDGTDVEVFSREWLHQADEKDYGTREHVTEWMRAQPEAAYVLPTDDYSWLKLSVNTEADLERARCAMAHLPHPKAYTLADMLAAVEAAGYGRSDALGPASE